MKYLLFFIGLYFACNESFDLQTSFIGLGLMGLSVSLIVDGLNVLPKSRK